MAKEKNIFESCPHCGEKLNPWQQVLLSVDRALMCKNCWYRIRLNKNESEKTDDHSRRREED